MVGLLVGAGILAGVIAFVGQADRPDWGTIAVCVLAALVPSIIASFFQPVYFFIGLILAAACTGFAVSALCGISVARSSAVAVFFLIFQFTISFLVHPLA